MLILFGFLFEPHVNAVFWAFVRGASDLVGIPRDLAAEGLDMIQFWK
jgi:hypothetical protein